ncbi:uncharacterized protein LOC132134798 [Carassius carassius]|uniref:uncharacterized protein LOC132134795 n=3 Tax=Carassius carassius TaxID=217509 RepID=UPI002868A102|nr:uncharacterized protein LOC132134795 [Carassius carassius]XP_059403141.1 uncharacterized protein LOC132134796 [Carassius carassius]XP_059403142.1 uncharacterized protein LOC132134797 [Carassius carassius]XP_059403143.1 uncharacterized protein LOC132134798 [Carassius carassius]
MLQMHSMAADEETEQTMMRKSSNGRNEEEEQRRGEVKQAVIQKQQETNKATGHLWEEGEENSRGVQGKLKGKYNKELTVEVEVEGNEKISMMDLLKGVKKECGEVIGCRVRGERVYELTMKDEETKRKLMDGVRVKGVMVHARDILNNDMVVSFINLPVYLEDEKILAKLHEWGVRPLSPIKRRVWPGTDIVDGTRFLKVRFTEQVCSLPYSTKFETLRGTEFFRVIHDRQIRVCRLCIKPGHIIRECPELKCFKCNGGGHYARDCEEWMGLERERVDVQEYGKKRNSVLTEEQEEETTDVVSGGEKDGAEDSERRSKMEWRDRAESFSEADDGEEEEEMEQSEEIEEEEETDESNVKERGKQEENKNTAQKVIESRGGEKGDREKKDGLKTKIKRLSAKRKSEIDGEQVEQIKEPRAGM